MPYSSSLKKTKRIYSQRSTKSGNYDAWDTGKIGDAMVDKCLKWESNQVDISRESQVSQIIFCRDQQKNTSNNT